MHAPAPPPLSRRIRSWTGRAAFAGVALAVAAEAVLQVPFVREAIRARAEAKLASHWPGATIERCAAADVTGVVRFDGVRLPVGSAHVQLDGLEIGVRLLPLLRGTIVPARVRARALSARATLPAEAGDVTLGGELAVAVLGTGDRIALDGPLRVRVHGPAELCARDRCLLAETFAEADIPNRAEIRYQAFGDDVRIRSGADDELPLPPLAAHGMVSELTSTSPHQSDGIAIASTISVGSHGTVIVAGEVGERLELRVKAETDRYAALVDSMPLELEPVRDLRVDGPVTASATLAGPRADPQAWEIDLKLDLRALRTRSQEHGAGDLLKRAFVYKPSADPLAPPVWMGESNPDFLPLDQIPELVQKAVLLSEDSFFLTHSGFDSAGIVHALKTNLREGETKRGGSTITQQLAKNLWLTRDRTFRRKFEEALLTIALEAALSKERILEIYLNGIEWGPGVYGIRAAARHYFAKDPAELTPKEGAWLATVIPSPRRYYGHFTRGELTPKWEERVMQLLVKMQEGGFMTAQQVEEAAWTPLRFTSSGDDPWTEAIEEPSWSDDE